MWRLYCRRSCINLDETCSLDVLLVEVIHRCDHPLHVKSPWSAEGVQSVVGFRVTV